LLDTATKLSRKEPFEGGNTAPTSKVGGAIRCCNDEQVNTLTAADKKKHVVQWTIVASFFCFVPSMMSFGLHGANLFAYLFYPYSCLLGGLLQYLESAYTFNFVVVSMLAHMPLYGLVIGSGWIHGRVKARCTALISAHIVATAFCFVTNPLR